MTDPTAVLVHGAAHGAWCWDAVRERLKTPSVAVDLLGHGDRGGSVATASRREFVDGVVADLAREVPGGDVVLVGHSLGGVLLPFVADRLPGRVAHLLFVAAYFPPDGGGPMDFLPLRARLPVILDARRRAPKGVAIPRKIARRAFCNDMTDEQAEALLGRLGRQPSRMVAERFHLPDATRAIPQTYLWFSKDLTLPERKARAAVENLGGGARFVTVDAGHDGIITKPEEVAEVIEGIVATVAA